MKNLSSTLKSIKLAAIYNLYARIAHLTSGAEVETNADDDAMIMHVRVHTYRRMILYHISTINKQS